MQNDTTSNPQSSTTDDNPQGSQVNGSQQSAPKTNLQTPKNHSFKKSAPKRIPILVAIARQNKSLRFDSLPKALDLLVQTVIFAVIFLLSSFVLNQLTFRLFAFIKPPATNEQYLAWALFATIGTIAAVLVYCRFAQGRKLKSLGTIDNRIISEYLAGLVTGTVLFATVIAIGLVAGVLQFNGLGQISLWVFFLLLGGFAVQSFSEELLCRGYFMITLSSRHNIALSVALSSIAFSLLHLANSGISALGLLNIALFGAFAGIYMLKRGNIWGVAAIHCAWNFVQGNVFGLSVSGLVKMDSVIKITAASNDKLLTGGAFGPEASIICTGVLALAVVVSLFMKNRYSLVAKEVCKPAGD